jgi:adenine phosphoribosyltransferase
VHISKNAKLANFSFLGDVELVDAIADVLMKKLKPLNFDYFAGPEAKVVPLVHALAKRSGHKRFIICRKSVKPYMVNPTILRPLPNFPKHVQQLVINGSDAELVRGKRVIIVDDVVSTGITMKMMGKLMEKAGATVVKAVAVLRQGEQFSSSEDLLYLGDLPIVRDKIRAS